MTEGRRSRVRRSTDLFHKDAWCEGYSIEKIENGRAVQVFSRFTEASFPTEGT